MVLTGKCKDDFLKWLSFNHGLGINDFELGKRVFLNALIFDFFDFKGIKISIIWDSLSQGFDFVIDADQLLHKSGIYTRQECIGKAIIECDKHYNKL